MDIGYLFLLFIIYSFIGWLTEVIFVFICEKKLVDRGFLIGPCCPIYGCGGILINLTLTKYYDSPITLFVMAMFICALLEYITSYLLEKLFKARWWDYTQFKFNINGRICLEILGLFGILGCFIIYFVDPLLNKFLSLLSPNIINILAIIFGIMFIIDLSISLKIISNFKNATLQFRNKDNTEEITKKVKETLAQKSFFNKRLIIAFPNLKAVIVSIKNEFKKTKIELKLTKKELKMANKKLKKVEKKLKNR